MTTAIDASRPAPPCALLGGRATEIVTVARRLLESEGADALTMRRLGAELSMKAPSLYKHLPGKTAIEAALVEQAFLEIGARLREAVHGLEPTNAISPLLAVYRDVGRQNPNLYRLATVGPLDRQALSAGIEDWAGEPFVLVAGDPHRARALWSAAHGMVILELDGRYPPGADLDQMWSVVAATFGPPEEKRQGTTRSMMSGS